MSKKESNPAPPARDKKPPAPPGPPKGGDYEKTIAEMLEEGKKEACCNYAQFGKAGCPCCARFTEFLEKIQNSKLKTNDSKLPERVSDFCEQFIISAEHAEKNGKAKITGLVDEAREILKTMDESRSSEGRDEGRLTKDEK